ncbi:hypothetical protein K435DRAFT_671417 [Dendrothele bispora CBS 962.96]|uniref:DDE-1 domain-containing protein n=1 Tax=Dendrothele bispora (strain CBS 962.96) TaxID=1314807 RepID=A0A4S8LTI4_DENBC|nr:hypothetical protein K435DRAFT_671417 [Dendrothele bispora CBS 962.96]
MKPSLLEQSFHDGSKFHASNSFVRGFLHDALQWSRRKGTRVAQTKPNDWEDQCKRSVFRKAYLIKEYDILPALYVNSNQTQVLYAPGDKMTWDEQGSKQVDLVGGEEKRAFTAMVSVAADGTLLPFQAIYSGKSARSAPDKSSPGYDEATQAGIRFEYSGTATYWSNINTMKSYVNNILAPYFANAKTTLGRPQSQRTIWQLDVWSVQRSQEFRAWMKSTHPTIFLDYVPGGCTSVAQPCDVAMQRPFKQSIKKSYHEDIVNEALSQIKAEVKVVIFDKRVHVHRN